MGKITLRATIHDTAASIRLGGDGAFITFAVPEQDIAQAVALVALKKTPLKLTVEVDNGDKSTTGSVKSWP